MKSRLDALVLCFLLLIVAIPALIALPLLCLFAPIGQVWACIGAIDRFGNAAWSNGSEYETISSAAWRHQRRWLIAFCELLEPNHCQRAYSHERRVVDFANPPT